MNYITYVSLTVMVTKHWVLDIRKYFCYKNKEETKKKNKHPEVSNYM